MDKAARNRLIYITAALHHLIIITKYYDIIVLISRNPHHVVPSFSFRCHGFSGLESLRSCACQESWAPGACPLPIYVRPLCLSRPSALSFEKRLIAGYGLQSKRFRSSCWRKLFLLPLFLFQPSSINSSGKVCYATQAIKADLATERERQLTTARANQTTGLTNGR